MTNFFLLLNRGAEIITDLVTWPLRAWGENQFLGWQLVLISVLAGIGLLLIYGRISNQKRLAQVKRGIMASLLEAIVYRNDLRISLKSQGRLFSGAGRYFLLAVPPLCILAVPCIILLAEMNLRYNNRPLEPGETSLLTLELSDPKLLYRVKMTDKSGLDVTEPVRIKSSREVVWRIRPTTPGVYEPNIELAETGSSIKPKISVATKTARIESQAFASSWMQLLYPSPLLNQGSPPAHEFVSRLTLSYPERSYYFLGIEFHWIIVFLIISLAAGLAASRYFKIEI